MVSSALQDPEWKRTAVLRTIADIRALKSETGEDIVTTGSIKLVRELIAAGLVDEYRLFTYPVVLGRGQRLFANASEVPRLRLVESQPFFAPASCSCATGQPDGAPPAGTPPVRSTTAPSAKRVSTTSQALLGLAGPPRRPLCAGRRSEPGPRGALCFSHNEPRRRQARRS